MRMVTLGMILGLAIPAWAGDKRPPKQVCGDRCSSTYEFCQARASTKDARKSCKINRKNCQKQCSVK